MMKIITITILITITVLLIITMTIINNNNSTCSDSWGSEASTYDAFAASVDRFCWDNPDFLPIFAAGVCDCERN